MTASGGTKFEDKDYLSSSEESRDDALSGFKHYNVSRARAVRAF